MKEKKRNEIKRKDICVIGPNQVERIDWHQ